MMPRAVVKLKQITEVKASQFSSTTSAPLPSHLIPMPRRETIKAKKPITVSSSVIIIYAHSSVASVCLNFLICEISMVLILLLSCQSKISKMFNPLPSTQ